MYEDFYEVKEYVMENMTKGEWYNINDKVPTKPHHITKEEVIKLYCYLLSRCHYYYKYGEMFSTYPSVLAKKLNIELIKIKEGLEFLSENFLIIRENKDATYHNNHPLIIHTKHFPF